MTERGHHIRLKIIPFEKELLIGRHHGNADEEKEEEEGGGRTLMMIFIGKSL